MSRESCAAGPMGCRPYAAVCKLPRKEKFCAAKCMERTLLSFIEFGPTPCRGKANFAGRAPGMEIARNSCFLLYDQLGHHLSLARPGLRRAGFFWNRV